MVDRLFILSKLPIYTGTVNVITEDQSVKDIIRGVKMCHEKYANDYDKIGAYFIGNTAEDTCENIFNFLRKSSFYYQEGVVQTLRSPSAILSTGKTIGIDCKNMALFIGGCLNAINRSGIQNIPFCYRFVSDKLFDPTPNHVFIVAFPKTNDEIWIDPIPEVNYFDQRLTYYYHTDKKFSTMALQIISGRNGRYLGGASTNAYTTAAATAADMALPGSGIVVSILSSIFSANNAPNPNDWKGWQAQDNSESLPLGTNAQSWVRQDGDSVQNEAANIVSWIRAYGLSTVINQNANMLARFGSYTTLQDVANKLNRGGFPMQAQQILQSGTTNNNPLSTTTAPLTTTATSTNKYLIIVAVLIGGYLLLKKR